MDRRTSLSLIALTVAGAALPSTVNSQGLPQKSGKIKYTALYGAPKDPEAFEKHYAEILMPMVLAAGLPRFEASKCMPNADGSAPAFFRIFEAWFDSTELMNAMFATPHWAKVRADVPTFASGGVTRFVSVVS